MNYKLPQNEIVIKLQITIVICNFNYVIELHKLNYCPHFLKSMNI